LYAVMHNCSPRNRVAQEINPPAIWEKKQKTKHKKKKRARQNEREEHCKTTHIGETNRKQDRENEKGNLTRERESLQLLCSFLPLLLSLPPPKQNYFLQHTGKRREEKRRTREARVVNSTPDGWEALNPTLSRVLL
jgi:hypothetical protein